MILIRVNGDPKGQPRTRAFAFRGKAKLYTPGQADDWKALIALAARDHVPEKPIAGPVKVDMDFTFRRPKGHFRTGCRSSELKLQAPNWHTVKPDRDNLEKAVLDVLTQIGMWEDDCQVCCGEIRKWWCVVGDTPQPERPGVTIKIRPLRLEI